MSDDIPASLAEAMAEIRRLRGEAATMRHPSGEACLNTYVPPEYVALPKAELVRLHARIAELEFYDAMMAEYRSDRDRLQARVAELEGVYAVTFGTLEQPFSESGDSSPSSVPASQRTARGVQSAPTAWLSQSGPLPVLHTEPADPAGLTLSPQASNPAELAVSAAERSRDESAKSSAFYTARTPDEPATYTHNVPPSAPPHDNPKFGILEYNQLVRKSLEWMNEPEPENDHE